MTPFSKLPDRIVIHCSATDDSPGKDADAIRAYHKSLGWDDIGYHFLIEDIGGRAVMVAGRSPQFEGAHCKAAGRNRDSLGVCVVGDFDKAPAPPQLFYRAARLVALLCFCHGIAPAMVSGHREWEPRKTCPGRHFDLVEFRAAVEAYLEAYRALGVGQEG